MHRTTRNFSFMAGFPVAIILSFFFMQNVFADANGRANRSGLNGTTCATTGCHAPGAAVPMVAFTAPTSVMAGSVNVFTVTISGGPGVRAGIDVATSAGGGVLSAPGAGAKILSGEIVHSAPKPLAAGSASFGFTWTAPLTGGMATLYVAGMTDNGNGTDGTGDGTTLITRTITVTGATNVAPVASIGAPATGTAGVPVTFSGATSTDADGTIAAYAWNFGDGTAGAGSPTTHSFVAGTYTVTLTVTDNAGATNAATQSIVISPATTPPVTVANPGGPYTGMPGVAVQFSGATSTGSIASYVWNFGDGTASVTGVSPTHIYATSGTFKVSLTVTDTTGAVKVSSTTVTVGAAAADPSAGEVLYEENCAGCHSAAGPGPSIFGESVEDIMEAFTEYPDDHADVSGLLDEEIADIAEFLNAAPDTSVGQALYEENCASCHSDAGPGPSIFGESYDDILEAFEEYPDEHADVSGLPDEDIVAIAEYLNACTEEEEEEDESFVASLLNSLDDDDDEEEGGACSGGGPPAAFGDGRNGAAGAKDHSNNAAATATGAFDLLTLVGAGLFWARRRRKN